MTSSFFWRAACFVANAPWGVSLSEAKGCVRFLYLMRGSCWLSIDKTSQPRLALSGGDLAVMPQGHGYAIRDQPRSHAINFDELARRNASATQGSIHHIKLGGAGVELTRMADVILVQVLRAYMESLPEGSEGFLGALRDKHMAAALGLMHQRPEDPWTVALLADRIGLSRSAFAARFAALVGEPPLGYLTRLRMQRASILLRDGATLARASEMTGYSSEASFSYAFRQWAGIAPGAYRRRARSAVE